MVDQDTSTTPLGNSLSSATVAKLLPVIRVVESKGISQKKAIEALIPHLYVLRQKGCSWEQITGLLNDKCGFIIRSSTVRTYFSDLVPKHREICIKALAEYLITTKKAKNDKDKYDVTRKYPVE